MDSPPSTTASGFSTLPGTDGDRRTRLLEALIESVFDGVLIVSSSGKMIYHNQLFLDIWNFPPEILASGSDEVALCWAADQTTAPAEFLARVKEVYDHPAERVREEVLLKDGRIYERCGSIVRTGDNDEPWMWTFRDITPRRQSELALQHSEHRYRTLFDSMDEGFCVIQMLFDDAGCPNDYLFLEVNQAFKSQTGMENTIGRRVREYAPDHEQHWFDLYGGVALKGEPIRFEHEAKGLGRWYEVYAFQVDSPELCRVGVLFKDATERRQATEALRASEKFSRAVMECSPDCVKILDAAGRLQFMNASGLSLMEIDDFTPFVGQEWGDLWRSEDLPMISACMDLAVKGESSRFQAQCPTAKGTLKWWDVMLAPFDNGTLNSGPAGLISVSRDITEAKRAEEELRLAKEAAEAASQAKDRFLATLSHELRTPLSPVLLTASALSEDATLPPALRSQLRMIERNISLEARLIDDLLDLTRVSSGKLTLRNELCDVHSLLGMVVEMVQGDAKEKSLTFHLDLGAQESSLLGDPTRLQQVFWNLLRNAVKFTPEGGEIFVRTRDGGEDPAAPRIVIKVQDTGIGIAPGSLETIFKPFEQERRPSASSTEGLGLGLAIARAIVELHHGTLQAGSSGNGKGSTFTIDAPSARRGHARLAPRDLHATPPLESVPLLRLLLVEDHQATLDALAALLGKDGHTVVTATSLAAARLAAAAQTFDGLISDVGLPDGTGFQLMAELSAFYGLRGIVLSGYGMEEDLRRSREVGFVAHLVKPVRISDLRQNLWSLLPAAK